MNRFFGLLLSFIALFSFASCRTPNELSISAAEKAGLYDILAGGESIDNASSDDKECYLFIRLYDPVYKNPLYMSTFLKIGIAMTEVHPLKLSHASLGLDLTDNFLGLTLMPRPMLNEEHSTNVSTNEFMKQCKMDKSSLTVFALPVTRQEYLRVKKVLYQYRDAKYSAGKVAQSGFKSIWRKMRRKKNRGLETALASKKGTAAIAQKMDKKRKFTCSSFAAFVLYNSVEEIHEYFESHRTNLNHVSVTDLAYLPGVQMLFSSSWQDYDRTAGGYADEHEELVRYTIRG